ncbi:hypothetical protein MKW94_009346 [Papaver nudicaule]|uniref:Uncharacterized protein n=1 Tax=Papaver nudicaule TaxID=74823 RepID=A0AA42B139_PAPNU|nr:hypothetical protein [Papaver nudicaule]
MRMFFSWLFRLLCLILLLSHVAGRYRGKLADKPRSPPPNLYKGPPSGRP